MIGMQNPAEPEAVEPRLAWEPEESPEVKDPEEPEVNDCNDAEESPLEPDEESLHGATVAGAAVGAAAVSFALTTGATTAGLTIGASGSGVVAKAPAMPPATAAAPAAAPTPMPIFCTSVKPSFLAATTGTAQGFTGADAAAKPTNKLNNTTVRAIEKAFSLREREHNQNAKVQSR